ncbi:carbohydrate ABC transporter, N-acetylglucosamine/diacetylchitobiose-binding protein [Streptomyces sp. 3MP-14]|uniref:Carbohydrate ABC transporter, N-acetylglucosamine/diacetylchitobiose-binding protein n=1 Tax=Streptomyces mimosae TaxID=2586635 RepID=A0A5N6AGQ5_9ACTN|nr:MULTISPECIES: N-acetylglucosamine/diacetylchitobiose ABC transporter substrate-binding protein [Streptomyces]KAB8167851.1 carbohydrate ABC transporter, N-acetylglucosamine/diacetylchitobiose-binding protein [Streptomyces mimosae]KAB8177501.1 carbohydrate ABC transporter, N-acetylglucosamine/diacetylchitobiose-binding protein [Streptomyces sp. 3MP-14]
MTSKLNRRSLLTRSAAAGLLSVPAVGALAGCASGGGDEESVERGETTDDNPLGVDPEAELEVIIFDGGFGDQYALDAEAIYQESYGQVTHDKTTEIQTRLQPRMVQGDPPDVINNGGADAMDIAALIRNGQVYDLNELLDAPSLDDPNVTVRETLMPSTVEMGQFGTEEVWRLNYAFTVYGQWYSRTALERLEVEYPRTWDEMIAVCEAAKRQGMAGWTYPGVYPYYFNFTLYPFIGKIGGVEVLQAIDNLEPNAWRHDAVKAAFEAYHELAARGYVLQGSPGMTHEESQDEWNAYQALFIPNGSWVENESRRNTPEDFDMAVGPPTGLDSSDAMPFETLWASASEPFFVPADATNPIGGLEFLRVMLGQESARNFTELVSSLTCVRGAADGMDLPPGLTSAKATFEAAGDNLLVPRLPDWYKQFNNEEVGGAVAAMMAGDIDPDEAITRCQRAADATASDDSIQKFQHV